MEKRVVITGLGAISPIGNNVKDLWDGIKTGKCGIEEIKAFDTTNFKTKLGAEVKEYDALNYFEAKQAKRLDRVSQFAIIAAREAFEDSGITKENTDFERVGIYAAFLKSYFAILVQPLKMRAEISTLPLYTTEVKPVQSRNASIPMLVTLLGMVTEVKPVQP